MIKEYTKYQGKENDFQITVVRYLNSLNVLFAHPPNGGSRHKIEAVNLKRQGVKKGLPDLLIFEPKNGYNGLAIELKVGYNKPSKEQYIWLEELRVKGWVTHWTNSLDEAIDIIDNYLGLKNGR